MFCNEVLNITPELAEALTLASNIARNLIHLNEALIIEAQSLEDI